MAVPKSALKKWEKVREFALGLPHAHALTSPGAEPAAYGPGGSGWVRIPLERSCARAAGLLCDRAEESHRVVAPEMPVAELGRR
ncbi:hypothetical protein [Streptomyces siamensis]|uniref:hypothetical protein n=1 Tax=Streptomyces siamensis TaxID=1274986 RepID=UPI0031F0A04B